MVANCIQQIKLSNTKVIGNFYPAFCKILQLLLVNGV